MNVISDIDEREIIKTFRIKRLILFAFLFFSINLFGQNSFFKQSAQKFVKELEKLSTETQPVILGDFAKNKKNNFKIYLEEQLISSKKFEIIAFEDLSKLQKIAIKQSDGSFDSELEIGKFLNSRIMIDAEVEIEMGESFFEKKKLILISVRALDIEKGTLLLKRSFKKSESQNHTLIFLIIFNFLVFIILYSLNYVTKGYFNKLFFIIMLLITIVIWIYYFIKIF
ncbi:MAG: hypothetical protein U9N34_08040 [Candidatus Cloacimonadota bacterium]|nr:hypothetical protein [Candidatus Cloacimonadota bacterium]